MRTVSICLNLAVWLFFFMGATSAFVFSPYLLIPVLAVCMCMGFCSHSIQCRNKTGAIVGIVLMVLMTFSILFPLGLAGLIGAYRGKDEWATW